MYCKSCGKMIDGNPPKCPYCNADVVYEGGNGFWDVATLDDGPPRKEPERTVIPTTPGKERETDRAILSELSKISSKLDATPPKKPGASAIILIALVAVCVLLCAVNLLSSSRAISQIEKGTQETAESLEALRIAVATTPEPEHTPVPAPVFFKQPTDEEADEGWEGAIFTVEICPAKSEAAAFNARWQYKAADGEFADLGDNAVAWGLSENMERRDNGHYIYSLSVEGLKANAAGSYRLVLTLEDGIELASDTVTLNVTPAPTPEPEPTPEEMPEPVPTPDETGDAVSDQGDGEI